MLKRSQPLTLPFFGVLPTAKSRPDRLDGAAFHSVILAVLGACGTGMVGQYPQLSAHRETLRNTAFFAGYLPVGALVLWGLGQLAVLAPALRAAAVPPVVATRGV